MYNWIGWLNLKMNEMAEWISEWKGWMNRGMKRLEEYVNE